MHSWFCFKQVVLHIVLGCMLCSRGNVRRARRGGQCGGRAGVGRAGGGRCRREPTSRWTCRAAPASPGCALHVRRCACALRPRRPAVHAHTCDAFSQASACRHAACEPCTWRGHPRLPKVPGAGRGASETREAAAALCARQNLSECGAGGQRRYHECGDSHIAAGSVSTGGAATALPPLAAYQPRTAGMPSCQWRFPILTSPSLTSQGVSQVFVAQ